MHHYLNAIRHYVSFSGRASRAEFWQFTLVLILGSFVVALVSEVLFGPRDGASQVLPGLWTLAHLLPGLAVTVRRLHDIDRTGWWVLLNLTGIGSIVGFIFAMMPGTEGTNRFGPAPAQHTATPVGPVGPSMASEPWAVVPTMGRREEPAPMPFAAPTAAVSAQQPTPSRPIDVIGDLERLSQLRAAGGLTEAEFEAMKARTLNGGGAV